MNDPGHIKRSCQNADLFRNFHPLGLILFGCIRRVGNCLQKICILNRCESPGLFNRVPKGITYFRWLSFGNDLRRRVRF